MRRTTNLRLAALCAVAGGARPQAADLLDDRLGHPDRAAARLSPGRPGGRNREGGAKHADGGCATSPEHAAESQLVRPLFLRPTGLADGLASKEQRYGR